MTKSEIRKARKHPAVEWTTNNKLSRVAAATQAMVRASALCARAGTYLDATRRDQEIAAAAQNAIDAARIVFVARMGADYR